MRSAIADLGRRAIRRYRATGADLPFGDPLPWHGVAMEGYFWRLTDPVHGRVVTALTGINTPATGPPWATVGIAAEPEGVLETAELADAWADPGTLGIRVGDHVLANDRRVRMTLDTASVRFDVESPIHWPHRMFGGSSMFQTVPGLNQYWHPWLLGGVAWGSVVLEDRTIAVDGWQVDAEKNWGRDGFPTAWWWGKAQGFSEPTACLAFAGGRIIAGPTLLGRRWETEVTALVVALPDGRVIRLGDPIVSPVETIARPGSWQVRGRSRRWQIEVDAYADPDQAFVLPIPLVNETPQHRRARPSWRRPASTSTRARARAGLTSSRD